jgi:toxin HigB-1
MNNPPEDGRGPWLEHGVDDSAKTSLWNKHGESFSLAAWRAPRYIEFMIISFRHKGLEAFFRTGSVKGIQPAHKAKLARILTALDLSSSPAGVRRPGFNLHELKGDLAGHWSVWVSGNWRVTFRFAGQNAELVDYQDYH